MIKHLQELIAIPSVTVKQEGEKPFGDIVPQALAYMLELCDSFGFRTKNVDGMTGYAEIGEGEEMMGILCHLDVVPAGNDWTYPPFGGEIHDGKIYGRGAMDDKGPAMAAVYAMKDVLESGRKLGKRVRIIFGQSEEDGDWIDMDYYKAHEEIPAFGFTPDADFPAIYGEMGIAMVNLAMPKEKSGIEQISGGQAANMVPDQAEANVGGRTFHAVGKAAHGSTPWEGENAISGLMAEIAESKIDCPLARFYMEKIGTDLHGERINLALADAASGKLSLNVGKVFEADDMVKLALDIRFPVTYSLDTVLARLKEAVRPYDIEVEVAADMKPVYMEKDGKIIQKLMEAYREVTGDNAEPIVMGGGTYARAMDNIVAFGPVFPGRECTEHKKDEYIFVEDLEKARQIYRLAIEKLTEV